MEGNDDGDARELITRFETMLDTSEFSNEKYEKHLATLEKYYGFTSGFTSGIPAFVKLILILYNFDSLFNYCNTMMHCEINCEYELVKFNYKINC
jgi:hypothetical protein